MKSEHLVGVAVLLMAAALAGCAVAHPLANNSKAMENNSTASSNSSSSTTNSTSGNGSANSSTKMSDDVSFDNIMQKCNESNPVTMEYLSELNSTGSFPDETDKGPMCYIKCYLEGVGILSDDGSVNKDRAISMLWPNSVDAIDDCLKEQDGVFDKDASAACENAYYLTRCVMIKELLSTRTVAEI